MSLLPPSHSRRLENGLEVVAISCTGSPMASVALVLPVGGVEDPEGRSGLASLALQQLRRGTASMAIEAIDDLVERCGIDLSCDAGLEWSCLSATAPAPALPAMLRLMSALVREPAFDAREFRTARQRRVSQVIATLEEPERVVSRLLRLQAFPDHPYRRMVAGCVRDLEEITRRDLLSFHARAVRPSGATLVLGADLTPREMLRLGTRHFGSWGPSGASEKTGMIPAPRWAPRAPLALTKMAERDQAQVALASPGPASGDPGLLDARIACQLFGGSFTSRLMTSARVERGLTYGISSSFFEGRAGGLTWVQGATRTDSVPELIQLVLDEAARFRKSGPTEEELRRSRELMLGQLPMQFETVEAVVRGLAELKGSGRPDDWYDRFAERVSEAESDAVVAQARRFFFAEGYLAAIAGDGALARALESLGRVRIVSKDALR